MKQIGESLLITIVTITGNAQNIDAYMDTYAEDIHNYFLILEK